MRALLMTILLTASFCAYGQELKVSVVSDGAPLGYAYVYINGRIYTSADAGGHTYIPVKMISPGDTISASFVGAVSAAAIYDGKPELTVELSGALDIEGIEVWSTIDPERLFRKFVRRRGAGEWYDAFGSDFTIFNDRDYILKGKFYRAYLPGNYVSRTGETTIQISAPSTKGDTLYRPDASFYLSYFFGCVINAGGLNEGLWFNKGMVVKYLGKHGDVYRFFLTRPMLYSSDSFQTIVEADAKTREVVAVKGDIMGANNMRIRFDASYVSVPGANLVYPGRVTGSVTTIGNQCWDISMENITYDDRHRVAAATFEAINTKRRRR